MLPFGIKRENDNRFRYTRAVNGTIYLAGFPQYNDKTKEVYFDQLDYALIQK
jgi:hypothetical protein